MKVLNKKYGIHEVNVQYKSASQKPETLRSGGSSSFVDNQKVTKFANIFAMFKGLIILNLYRYFP